MYNTVSDVLTFVEENDVKFIRLAFCDIFGCLKNISIMPHELARAFDSGVSFDASAVKGFMNADESDLFLFPDPCTLQVLPWRPSHGRVIRLFCDIRRPDGSPFEGDWRYYLKGVMKSARKEGYRPTMGTECEFYLFETDERGFPTRIPQDNASYCDVAPLDKGENVRREICLTLEEMGILPESSHHEQGPGQNEIVFRYSDALSTADNLMTFKSVVKAIANQNGLYASFMPKPLPGMSGSGLHVNLSLFKDDINLFKSGGTEHSREAESFMAGILEHISDITLFLNPTTNSYKRFGAFEAPEYLTWSHQNRSQLIRIPASPDERHNRMELRSPDPSCNPYLAFSLLIQAGLDGIRRKTPLPPPTNVNLFSLPVREASRYRRLPESLEEAIEAAASSEFLKSILPEAPFGKYLDAKREEWQDYRRYPSQEEFEYSRYFEKL